MVSKSARQGPSGLRTLKVDSERAARTRQVAQHSGRAQGLARARALTYDLVPKRGDAIGVVAFLGGNHLLGGLDACSPARGGELVVHMVLFFVPPICPQVTP